MLGDWLGDWLGESGRAISDWKNVGKEVHSRLDLAVRCEIDGVVKVMEPSDDSQSLLLPHEVLRGESSLLRQSPKSAMRELKGDTSPLLHEDGEGSFMSLTPQRERPTGNFKPAERPVLTREGRHCDRLITRGSVASSQATSGGRDRTLRPAPIFAWDVMSSMKVFLTTWPKACKVSSCKRCACTSSWAASMIAIARGYESWMEFKVMYPRVKSNLN
jgi:hypothetical protein